MLQTAPFGRALPAPPPVFAEELRAAEENDLGCARHTTPRPPAAVERLAGLILTRTMRAKYWIASAGIAFGLWILGTAAALVITKLSPASGGATILWLGFGGLGGGLAAGYLWIRTRRIEAQTIAREGQLVAGTATYQRAHETFGGELGDMLAAPLGETRYCITFSIGFIRHTMWVALPEPHEEGESFRVLVQPGARVALAFDARGCGYVGELQRIS